MKVGGEVSDFTGVHFLACLEEESAVAVGKVEV